MAAAGVASKTELATSDNMFSQRFPVEDSYWQHTMVYVDKQIRQPSQVRYKGISRNYCSRKGALYLLS